MTANGMILEESIEKKLEELDPIKLEKQNVLSVSCFIMK